MKHFTLTQCYESWVRKWSWGTSYTSTTDPSVNTISTSEPLFFEPVHHPQTTKAHPSFCLKKKLAATEYCPTIVHRLPSANNRKTEQIPSKIRMENRRIVLKGGFFRKKGSARQLFFAGHIFKPLRKDQCNTNTGGTI